MEKTQLLGGSIALPLQGRVKTRRNPLTLFFISLLSITALFHFFRSNTSSSANKEEIVLGKLIPTECWSSSFEKPFKCYHLYAPLDYLNETDERTARLAVATYPAGGGKTKKGDILGTLLLNPGGPGGSGLEFISRVGSPGQYKTNTAAAFDSLLQGRYNILSWDPRAIGRSTPHANCYKWSTQEASSCQGGLPRASSAAIGCILQSNRLQSKFCSEHPTLSDELRFVTTPSTARDMKLLHRAAGDKVLHYWGFSYGTALGSVFADMFPQDVGRLVLDGTVDLPNYLAGNWSDNLLNTQDTYEKGLLGKCVEAGDRCALNQIVKNGKDLKAALDDLFTELIKKPMLSTQTNTTFLDYSTFKMTVFDALYSPWGWRSMTNAMAQVLSGNASAFIEAYVDVEFREESTPHAMQAIAGGDALIRREHTWGIHHYKALIADLEKQSDFAGEIWAEDKSAVQTWSIVGKERHFGNFTSHTRHPILYVGNDYDPVTPLQYSRKMATLFPNAAVLRVKSFGHCSISQPSTCASNTIAAYFVNGTVPERKIGSDGYVEPGVVCEVDRDPWDEVKKEDDEEAEKHSVKVIMDSLLETWK